MLKDDHIYLEHMLEAAQGILKRIIGVSKADYDRNEDLRIILVHLLQVIGEAARNVSPETCCKYPNIPWEEVIGMRHRLVHDYINVKYTIVWQVVTQDIQVLSAELEKAVREL